MTFLTLILIAVIILAVIGLGWNTFVVAVLDGFDRTLDVSIPILRNLTQEAQAMAIDTIEDKLKIAPFQNLCGPQYSPCVDILHEGNNTIVLKGDEFVPNTEPGGMEFMLNPGFWKIVDFYVGKGFNINTVFYVENEDVNSYRVVLTKQ